MADIEQSLRVLYTPEDILKLILNDMRARGHTVEKKDVKEPHYYDDHPTSADAPRFKPFEGYEIRTKKIIPPKIISNVR